MDARGTEGAAVTAIETNETAPAGLRYKIQLVNPVSEQWTQYMIANAQKCVVKHKQINGKWFGTRVAQQNSRIGQKVLICGAGPSLREHWRHEIDIHRGEIWACNSALPWLLAQGARVTHGLTIDQTPHMLEEWKDATDWPNVKYLLASTVTPALVDRLNDLQRHITFFHNFCGADGELEIYKTLWPGTVMVGDGLNAANRAACLAQFMGFKEMVVLGSDCALGENDEMHADGGGPLASGATHWILEGRLHDPGCPCFGHPSGTVECAGLGECRTWRTKPDMVFSAVAFAKMVNRWGRRRLRIVGDTLPHALRHLSDHQLDRVASLGDITDELKARSDSNKALATVRGKDFASDIFKANVAVAPEGVGPQPKEVMPPEHETNTARSNVRLSVVPVTPPSGATGYL